MGQLAVAWYSPGTAGPEALVFAGDDPSFARSATIACATVSPNATPSVFAFPSGIVPSEVW